MLYEVTIDGTNYRLELERADGGWRCHVDGSDIRLDAVLARPDVLSILVDGKSYEIKRERTANDVHLWVGSARYAAEVRDPRSLRSRQSGRATDHGPRRLVASMPGKIVRVLLRENACVEAGQGVLVVEAMKMQNEIKSPKKGVVQKIVAGEGTAVNAGDLLAIVE
ncbi:MAG TPA: biotin/lipoyl-containing protein [Terriglobales bacterium]|nr:biotin/lipoyl-containing protein [Terriglobales bacterium]